MSASFIDCIGISSNSSSPFFTAFAKSARSSKLSKSYCSLCKACTGMLLKARKKALTAIIVPNKRDMFTIGRELFII